MTTHFVVVKQTKSVGVAILLTLIFGPIGLFYASVSGGLIMTFTPVVLSIIMIVGILGESVNLFIGSLGLLVFFALLCWLVCIIWAVVAVNSYNRKIQRAFARQRQLMKQDEARQAEKRFSSLNSAPYNKLNTDSDTLMARSHSASASTPSFQEWLQTNPRGSLNHYYASIKRR